jgi:hypothetical protein
MSYVTTATLDLSRLPHLCLSNFERPLIMVLLSVHLSYHSYGAMPASETLSISISCAIRIQQGELHLYTHVDTLLPTLAQQRPVLSC